MEVRGSFRSKSGRVPSNELVWRALRRRADGVKGVSRAQLLLNVQAI